MGLGLGARVRKVAQHHVEVAVAPVRVACEKVFEDHSEGGLVLGHEARPLVEEVAKGAQEDLARVRARLRVGVGARARVRGLGLES